MNKIYKLLAIILMSSSSLIGCNKDNDKKEEYVYNGETPIFSSDSSSLTYGLYPQSYISDNNLIKSLNSLTHVESNGWYLYKGRYYAKIIASPYGNIYEFDNGDLIEKDKQYWFRCEPISWKILNIASGRYFILSEKLLDAHDYYHSTSERTIGGKAIYPNNYEYSDIRSWLNSDFYNSAFNLNSQFVLTTTVDNGAHTTNSGNNIYICNNTEDKVFLPSYSDYKNSTRYPYDYLRAAKTTDYARARGSYTNYNSGSTFNYCGNYYSRSPNSSSQEQVSYVYISGSLYGAQVNYNHYSARPALNIKVS